MTMAKLFVDLNVSKQRKEKKGTLEKSDKVGYSWQVVSSSNECGEVRRGCSTIVTGRCKCMNMLCSLERE